MPDTASLLTDQFATLLSRLPAGLDLDRLAEEHGALKRRRQLVDGAALLRLTLAHGPLGLSLRETAAWAGLIGLARISNPGVKYRLDHAGDFLAALVERMLAARAGTSTLCWKGRILRLADGTSLSEPGSTGTDWRVHGVFDLARGSFSELQLTDAQGAESLTRGPPIPGEVRIADRYFGQAAAMARYLAMGDGKADFIVRLRWNALALRQPDGRPFDLIATLAGLPAEQTPQELQVAAVLGGALLPLRLIMLRKPPAVAEAARQALKRNASRKQKVLMPQTLIAAEFVLMATSLPADDYPAEDVLAAYRLRWQIELAFKRLKSLIRIDRLPTTTPTGGRTWLYAHLVMALLVDEASQDFLEFFP